ncbi:MAG: copper resistance protein CopC, partial [Actinomycetota bacterium]|nr:copper resistance protein CopC [Actinomycetota bacterium]
MRRLSALLLALAAAVALAPAAAAHAKLVSTFPADGAILAEGPGVVRVVFDDEVVVGPDNAVVRNGSGSVLAGKPRLAARGRHLILPVRKLRDGDYSVRWRILSDDGHVEGGVFAFRIGSRAGPAPPVSVLRAESTRPAVADVVSRWLYLSGILVAGGAALFRIAVGGSSDRAAANSVALALVAVALGGTSLLHSAG